MSVRIEWSKGFIREVEKKMDSLPGMLREKMLKTALKESGEIFTARVKHNVRDLKAEGLDRWGKVSSFPLQESLNTKATRPTKTQVGVLVEIQATVPMIHAYAAAVEYGHDKWIYGVKHVGEKVQQRPFWRPAKTETRHPIERLVMRSLNRLTKDMVYRGK